MIWLAEHFVFTIIFLFFVKLLITSGQIISEHTEIIAT